jgi:hypothetical protein
MLKGKFMERGAPLTLLPTSGKSTVHLVTKPLLLLQCCGWPNSKFVGILLMFWSEVGVALSTIDAMSIPAGRSSGIAERTLIF